MSRIMRRTAAVLPRAARPTTATPVAAFQRVQMRSSSHGAGAHHEGAEESFSEESFSSPIWPASFIAGLAVILYVRVYPSAPTSYTSPALIPTSDNDHPITRYLAHHMPESGLWKGRNEKHLELAKAAADDKLLFQEAERPRIRRMRYLGTFDQASPNAIPVGSQADLSDLRIKSEKEDFGAPAASEGEDDE